MKLDDISKLKPGDDIVHKHYGLCEMRELQYAMGAFFGVLIRPKTNDGRKQIELDCGPGVTEFFEDTLTLLSIK